MDQADALIVGRLHSAQGSQGIKPQDQHMGVVTL